MCKIIFAKRINALRYRGLGSEIVRVLSEYPNTEMVNDIEGKEFKVILRRNNSTQVNETSTQENNDNTQETSETNNDSTQENDVNTTKTSAQLIIDILKQHPKANRKEIAEAIGITEDGVKKQLANLKKKGIIQRIGPNKGGHWQITDKDL